MDRVLDLALRRIVKRGNLEVITARDRSRIYGDQTGARVSVKFESRYWQYLVMLDPELRLGEAYVQGGLIVKRGSIADFLDILLMNLGAMPQTVWTRILKRVRGIVRRFLSSNNVLRAKTNSHKHYDLGYDIFRLFLDQEMQYSCAYFEDEEDTLDRAQQAKIDHIATKLFMGRDSRNLRVLDIGCGWGKLALQLAQRYGAQVVGINISGAQIEIANANLRSAQQNRSNAIACEFRLQDYRELSELSEFDRIVSVGMFEHVGKGYYRTFFEKCFNLLSDDGVMLLHTIGRWNEPREPNAWVWRYIFPGGYAPALSELVCTIERSGFVITDIEVLHSHYEFTLRHWRRRFMDHAGDVLSMLRFGDGERFIRTWEFYLAGFEAGFRYSGLVPFQIQLAKSNRSVPLGRRYMYSEGFIGDQVPRQIKLVGGARTL